MADKSLGSTQFRESVSSKIKTFNAEKPKIEEAPPLPYTKTQLLESTNTVTHDTLVICLDKPPDLEKTGTVVAGYDKKTGELTSFKRINPDVQAEYKRVNKYPPEVTDIEDLIKKGTNNPRLGVYKRKFTHDGKEFKVYSLASTDLETYINKKKKLLQKRH